MEFVKGETLDHQIKRSGRLEVQLARWKSRRRRPPDWPQLTNRTLSIGISSQQTSW